jgi:hypothetical protein
LKKTKNRPHPCTLKSIGYASIISLVLGVVLVACIPVSPPTPPATQVIPPTMPPRRDDLYRPPTAVPDTPLAPPLPSSTPTISPPTETPPPTATQVCESDLIFLEDLTIPDGTVVLPGLPVSKSWRVENSGTCNWGEHYQVRLVEGPGMGAAPEQALYPARSGTNATIEISFTAPLEPGRYRSAWQAYDPLGEPFGEIFFLEIVVN